MMKFLSTFWRVLKRAALDFNDDNGFKLAASLSYSTIFAMAPFLTVIISLAGIFLGRQAIEGKIYDQIRDFVGSNSAKQVQDIITNIRLSEHTVAGAIIGSVILVVTATGVFTEIQSSVNYMWSIQAKPQKGWLKFLTNRLLSFSLIIGLGFVSMVFLIVNSLVDLLSDHLQHLMPGYSSGFFFVINLILTLATVVLLFTVIFRILPDAVIRWKDAFIGALFTGVLFMGGKFLLGLYLGKSNIGMLYGTAASIVFILSWVYYSSIILYLGAEFTKVYAQEEGGRIRPSPIAVFIIKRETKELDSWKDPSA